MSRLNKPRQNPIIGGENAAPVAHDIDIFADDTLVEPYGTFTTLRDMGSVVYLPRNDVYALTRYEVIRSALADWRAFSSSTVGFNPLVNQILQAGPLASDPPIHTQMRGVLAENLSYRSLRDLQPRLDEQADFLLQRVLREDSFDAIELIAVTFPMDVVADLIGFADDVRDQMLRWGRAAMEVLGPWNRRTRESFPIAVELFRWCASMRAEDLRPGSVGRAVFEAEAEGAIAPGTAGSIIQLYLGAGVDTTIAALGNVIALLGARPDQLRLVRNDSSLIPAAFNEVLRYWSPIHSWSRQVTRDVEVDGAVIPAGSQVAVLPGSGNRDPRKFTDPDTFSVQRDARAHLSFGHGPHICAGLSLAQMEGQAMIRALARHVDHLVLAEVEREAHNTVRSIQRLPVRDVVAWGGPP